VGGDAGRRITQQQEEAMPTIDEAIASQAVATHSAGEFISDLQARVLAHAWHGGQGTALYSLTSTGAIRPDVFSELRDELTEPRRPGEEAELVALLAYCEHHDERGPVDGWAALRR
jgi:hypothetical protein